MQDARLLLLTYPCVEDVLRELSEFNVLYGSIKSMLNGALLLGARVGVGVVS